MNDSAKPEVALAEERIDSTFRNGSLTAIGVVVGFSLSFLSRWAGLPGEWTRVDLVAVAVILLGIALQIMSLSVMLGIRSLLVRRYKLAVRLFLTGLSAVCLGVLLAVFASVVGLGPGVLGG
ncbi:hypothetical protein SLNSH_22070 [Alsobacter soli]|uniref:Uncharacterized protein n=1 Tax=Alsobacter soli TaxID=2109933 RepID=A0A2T1HME8_9HYPH|nr:hypothetical protein [Alsobacter soli]PSC02812.1 hypothetical protein SLNSH_22070 [Alsobacter soli]